MFHDVSGLFADNPPARHNGVAVADLDGDGRFEFIVAGYDGPNRVLRWAGGQLRDLPVPVLADPDVPAMGVAAGDLDGDGREELYVHTISRHPDPNAAPSQMPDRLFRRTADGHWEDLFARPGNRAVRNFAVGHSVAVIDRRGVGRYGFFVANHGRPLRLYEVGPDGSLLDLAPPLGLDRVAGGRGVLACPLLSAHTDLFCTTDGGPNLFFRNRGDGTFEEAAGKLKLGDPDEPGRGVTAVDADGDGRLDLCWGNWESPHRLMVRRPCGGWADRATAGLAFPSQVRTVIAADFDNDGHDELFFNNLNEPNRLFRLVPGADPGEFEVNMLDPLAALDPEGHGTGAAVADIDGDGVLELLVAHGESAAQPLGLFKAWAAGNGWLRVQPLTRFGAPARGAVVRAEVGGRVRVKAICGGSGYLCQMEPVAHFGLGRELAVGKVTITWPDGAEAVLPNPGVNRTITVPYPRG